MQTADLTADQILALTMTRILCTLTVWRPEVERAMLAANLEPSLNDFLADLAAAISAISPDEPARLQPEAEKAR